MKNEEKVVGIVGLGLIGGSFSFALKTYTNCRVLGIDLNPRVLSFALKQGYIDEYCEDVQTALAQCDLVFLALYPKDTLHFLQEHELHFKQGAVVADFCGIKGIFSDFQTSRFTYVGCHPMAGKEVNGIENADKNLFAGASMLMMAKQPELKELYRKVGFARIVHTTPAHHDRLIGYTSQLPHVLAVAYVMMPEFSECDGYHAGSFKDVSRVARINETLWSELFCDNREALTKQIDTLTDHLNHLKEWINHDPEALKEALKNSRLRMEEKEKKK